jgi:hypothetical protein
MINGDEARRLHQRARAPHGPAASAVIVGRIVALDLSLEFVAGDGLIAG